MADSYYPSLRKRIDPLALLRYCTLITLALLLISTRQLWVGASDFPRVPVFAWAVPFPPWCDSGALMIISAALLLGFLPASRFPRTVQFALWTVCAGLAFSILLDQHRFQPWTYQFLIMLPVLAHANRPRVARIMRWFIVSIYVYSAISKADATFLETQGPLLLGGLLRVFHVNTEDWSATSIRASAALMPLLELFVGVLLAIPKSRRIGLVVSILLHIALLIALSPWGLDHAAAVLIWNSYFIVQNVLLFGSISADSAARSESKPRATTSVFMKFLRHWPAGWVGMAILWPILQPWGFCDHWPAWGLYSSRGERVRVYVDSEAAERFPPELRAHLGPPRWIDERRILKIDRWSLEAVSAPIYPQGRYRLAIALAVAHRYDLDSKIIVEFDHPADRFTGKRKTEIFRGAGEIEQATQRFWLNTDERTL